MNDDIGITVSVEKAIHNALRESAQAIWDIHGVCVKSVFFSWVDVSTLGEPRLILTDVEANTITKK
jgi:hypothetical protein